MPAALLVEPVHREAGVLENARLPLRQEEAHLLVEQARIARLFQVAGQRENEPERTVVVNTQVVFLAGIGQLARRVTVGVLAGAGQQKNLPRRFRREGGHGHRVLQHIAVPAVVLANDLRQHQRVVLEPEVGHAIHTRIGVSICGCSSSLRQ